MTTLQDREQAFEAKFAHDQDVRFRVTARRDKLFAQWVADQLGLTGPAKERITTSVLAIRDGSGHDALLLEHIAGLFSEHVAVVGTAQLASALADCEVRAQQQLLDGPPSVPERL